MRQSPTACIQPLLGSKGLHRILGSKVGKRKFWREFVQFRFFIRFGLETLKFVGEFLWFGLVLLGFGWRGLGGVEGISQLLRIGKCYKYQSRIRTLI